MNVRLSTVAGVPAAREHATDLHALSRLNFQTVLLEMAEGDRYRLCRCPKTLLLPSKP
jgi:hypothetical protein